VFEKRKLLDQQYAILCDDVHLSFLPHAARLIRQTLNVLIREQQVALNLSTTPDVWHCECTCVRYVYVASYMYFFSDVRSNALFHDIHSCQKKLLKKKMQIAECRFKAIQYYIVL